MTKFNIGIISTTQDLGGHRDLLRDMLLERGHVPESMEEWGGGPVPLEDYIVGKVAKYHAAFIIFGMNYGMPEGSQGMSPTHIEVIEVIRQNCPIFFLEPARAALFEAQHIAQGENSSKRLKMMALTKRFAVGRPYVDLESFPREIALMLDEAPYWIELRSREREAFRVSLRSKSEAEYLKSNAALREFHVVIERNTLFNSGGAGKLFGSINGLGKRYVHGTKDQIHQMRQSTDDLFRKKVIPSFERSETSFTIV